MPEVRLRGRGGQIGQEIWVSREWHPLWTGQDQDGGEEEEFRNQDDERCQEEEHDGELQHNIEKMDESQLARAKLVLKKMRESLHKLLCRRSQQEGLSNNIHAGVAGPDPVPQDN